MTAVKVDRDLVARVAGLAKIEVDGLQSPVYEKKISEMLSLFGSLSELESDDSTVSFIPSRMYKVVEAREDKVQPSLSVEKALSQATKHTDVSFRVSKIIE